MFTTTLLKSLPFVVAMALPIACIAETPEEEVLGAGEYQLAEGTEREARCVDRELDRDAEGRVTCRAIEVRRPDADGRCDCSDAGRRDIDDAERTRVRDAVERDDRLARRDLSCACELRQLERDPARSCEEERGDDLRDDAGERIDGWCGDVVRGVDERCDRCEDEGRRSLRFVGDARLREDAEVLVRCE